MPDVSDMELLRDYDRQGSEAAFAELVQRHINLVYSVAFRHVGIAAHAEEITQAVFVILARKAASLRPDTVLEGWLHETTRLTALSFLRGERRRQFREQEAYMQSTLQEPADAVAWNQLAPLLDEAMSRLGKKDRDAVMLRFFKDKNVCEVAAALRVSEAVAQRRVLRAVEKLRRFFTKRGVVLPAAVLTAAISANSVQAAPALLAKTATAVAITKGAAASGSTLTLIKGALKIMAWAKAKTTAVVSVGLILIFAGGTAIVISKVQSARWQAKTAGAYKRRNLSDPQYRALLTDLRANVWPKERRLAEAKIKSRQQTEETVNSATIDLKPYINTALTDSPASRIGNNEDNLGELPSGTHVFGGVPFDVEGLIQLDGTNMMMFKKHYPAEVDNIPINRRCAKIYLFHGANWIYPHDFGTTIAKLILHYADGSVRDIEIVAGQHVFDWWSPLFTTGVDPRYFKMAPGTERAWTGSNPFVKKIWPDESLVLYKSSFENPQPDVVISNLDYVSTVTGTAPFLAGLTVE
jgi:RNA polymerase sigma factor (sigma-70 family)